MVYLDLTWKFVYVFVANVTNMLKSAKFNIVSILHLDQMLRVHTIRKAT